MYIKSLVILLGLVFCAGTPAQAGVHYVSSNGTNSANCTRTAPCANIATALINANANDTIVCLSPVFDTGLLIGKSIDIDCSKGGSIVRDGGPGAISILIIIATSSVDPLRTVRLRGISIFGAGATSKPGAQGIDIQFAAAVFVEDVTISDMAQQGIIDERFGEPTKLYVTDSIIRNCGGPGIVAAAAAPAIVVLDNVRSENNLYGLAVATGNNVTVSRSVLSGNSVAGVIGDGGSQIIVDNSTISHNTTGVISGSSVRLSNNNIAFNGTAISGSAGTFGNNRFSGNTSAGTAPTPLGGASSDFAQQ